MKYIDSEKLIAEINERLMAVNLEKLGNFGSHRVWAYNDVKDVIDSLQQEQNEDLIQSWKDKAVLFANEHAKGKDIWVRDALYIAYISAIQDTLKIRII